MLSFNVFRPSDATDDKTIRIELFDPYANHTELFQAVLLTLEGARGKMQYANLLPLKPQLPLGSWNTFYMYGIAVSKLMPETLHVVGGTRSGSGVTVTGLTNFENDKFTTG